MKTATKSILIAAILTVNVLNANANRYFRIVTDSVCTYSFDYNANNYKLASVSYYYYNNGLIDSIISTSSARIPVSKTVYYRAEDVLTGLRTFSLRNGIWEPGQNQEMQYDDQGRMIRNVVTIWRVDHWENLNIFTQTYNAAGNLEVFHRDFWSNNRWNDFSTDSLFYDQDGILLERSARLTSTGQYHTRILYNYSSNGLQYSQTRQFYVNSGWVNSSHTDYIYNKCGTQTASYNEKWLNGEWVADTKSEIYSHYELLPRVRKVPVCHEGVTYYVLAVQTEQYLAAGVCLGECIDPGPFVNSYDEPDPVAKSRTIPFVIFPNPARDYLNIRLTDQDCTVGRVELLDLNGRTVISLIPHEEETLTIDLTSLRRGNYVLRITADTVYNTVISRK